MIHAPTNESLNTVQGLMQEAPKALEVAPGKFLVSMEALNLRDGSRIESGVWGPILKGELTVLWDTLLQEEGDFVIVKGSSVLKMLFGGYVYDETTGLANKVLRSDVDVLVYDSKLMERTARFAGTTTYISKKMYLNEIEVGIVDGERIRQINLDVLEQLLVLYPEGETNKRVQTILDAVKVATPAQLLALDNTFKQENLGIKLVKEHGETTAYMVDPTGVLSSWEVSFVLSQQQELGSFYGVMFTEPNPLSTQALLLELMPEMTGAKFDSKIPQWAVNAISRMIKSDAELNISLWGKGGDEDFYTKLYKVAERLMRGDKIFELASGVNVNDWFKSQCLEAFARSCATNHSYAFNDIFFYLPLGDLVDPKLGDISKPYQAYFKPNTELLFSMHGLQDKYYREYLNGSELPLDSAIKLSGPRIYLNAVQDSINQLAGDKVTDRDLQLALGTRLYDPKVAEDLEKLSKEVSMKLDLEQARDFAVKKTIEDLINSLEVPVPDADKELVRKSLFFFHNFNYIAGQEEGIVGVHMRDPKSVVATNADMLFANSEKPPKDMSHVMAMLLYSAGWKPETNMEDISRVVSNWKPTGILKSAWLTQVLDFDKSLNMGAIVSEMRILEQKYKLIY